MAQIYLSKEEMNDALREIMTRDRLFGPVSRGHYHGFAEIKSTEEIDWECPNPRLSPKELFHPPSERMFDYSLDEDDPEKSILKEAPKDFSHRVILGIRPCDARALQLVDANFDTAEYKDPWWVKRRERTILVGLACNDPCTSCFCTAVETGPFDPSGLDVMLIDMGEGFIAGAHTPKGEELLSEITIGEELPEHAMEKIKDLQEKAEKSMTTHLSLEVLSQKDAGELFQSPLWEDIQFSCINCGVCTFLCPTCWCFDIQDEVYENRGDRIRNWDSCMFPLFTLHGSGHNPRNRKLQRVRQRFMHKFKYYPDKYQSSMPACVGCGRCVKHCPVNIDVREVVREMTAS